MPQKVNASLSYEFQSNDTKLSCCRIDHVGLIILCRPPAKDKFVYLHHLNTENETVYVFSLLSNTARKIIDISLQLTT